MVSLTLFYQCRNRDPQKEQALSKVTPKSMAEPHLEFKAPALSVDRFLLSACKYLPSPSATWCWHNRLRLGLRDTKETRESELVKNSLFAVFHQHHQELFLHPNYSYP